MRRGAGFLRQLSPVATYARDSCRLREHGGLHQVNRIQALVDALADELGRPVGVDDRRLRAIAYSAHPDDVDAVRRRSILQREAPPEIRGWLRSFGIESATSYVRVPADERFGMVPRVCFPIRFQDTLLAHLWLIEDTRPLDERSLERVGQYVDDLAEELWRARVAQTEARALEARVVRDLVQGTAGDASARWREIGRATASFYSCLLLLARPGPGQGLPAVEARLAAAVANSGRAVAQAAVAHVVYEDRAILVLAHDDQQLPARLASALHSAAVGLFADSPSARIVVGVGDARTVMDALPASLNEAEHAGRLALSLESMPLVAVWRKLGAYRMIAALLGDAAPAEHLPPTLKRLLADSDARTLVPTLESYLEHAGDARATADALFLHRSSLYSRLHRIEEIAGVDLRSGDDRLDLHIGIRLWRLAGAGGSAP